MAMHTFLFDTHGRQRGDIAIYTALMVLTIILSSALVMSLVLARQLRQTGDVIASEQAFYAANSGLEHGLYILAKDPVLAFSSDPVTVVPRPEENLTFRYEGSAVYREERDDRLCVKVTGLFRGERRTLQLGGDDCFNQ